MRSEDYADLLGDVERELIAGGARSVGIIGLTNVALRLLESLTATGLLRYLEAVYTNGPVLPELSVPVRDMTALREAHHDLIVVAADDDKEELLRAALPHIAGSPRLVVAGYGHLAFRDPMFRKAVSALLVPSLANGYPNSLVHLYQCLVNAARLRLRGVVAEFGMFKGGTTMFLSKVVESLGRSWPIIGFDTFSGFPRRRSPLDMYDHPDCVFTDLPAVRRHLAGSNIEIVPGDIVETCSRLAGEDVVLAFLDTDNYSAAAAALAVVRERTVVHGAIVFDHFTGVDRFRYTLGERMAGSSLLDDSRYFNLHGTGVFYRQR